MAKITVKITNIDTVKKKIRKKISSEVFPKVLKTAENNAIPKLIEEFNDALERTEAFQGLNGAFQNDENRDVSAHLGIIPEFAEDSIDQIKRIIKDKVFRADAIGKSRDGAIGFKFTVKNIAEELLQIPNATYPSKSTDIPWLQWLLKGGSVDAEIVFGIKVGRDRFETSRSERAIMRPTGDWNIDDYNRFSKNGNFLADALLDEIWIANSEKIIIDEVKKALKNINV